MLLARWEKDLFRVFSSHIEDTMPVGPIQEAKILMEETGIPIIMNGKIKILIHHKNVHGTIIHPHPITTNGMDRTIT